MLVEQVRTMGGHCGLLTVTVNVQLVLLPQASEAVQGTTVVPSGKLMPLGELLAMMVILDEQMSRMGGLLTVTGNWQLVWLPQPSVAVHVTEVVPMGKVLPLGGLQVTDGGGIQPPLAVLV